MVPIALLLFFYVTAPPFGPRLTTAKLGEDHFRTIGQIPENPGPKLWRARAAYSNNTCQIQCVGKRRNSNEGAEDGGQEETTWTRRYAAYHSTSSKGRSPTMIQTELEKGVQFSKNKVGQIVIITSMLLKAYFMIHALFRITSRRTQIDIFF